MCKRIELTVWCVQECPHWGGSSGSSLRLGILFVDPQWLLRLGRVSREGL